MLILSNSHTGERLEMTKWNIVSAVSCVALLFVISARVEGQPYDSSKKSKELAKSATTKETDFPTSETTDTSIASREAPAQQASPKWEFSVAPYAFFAALDGRVGVVGQTAQVDARESTSCFRAWS